MAAEGAVDFSGIVEVPLPHTRGDQRGWSAIEPKVGLG